jgi:hypothetical protein
MHLFNWAIEFEVQTNLINNKDVISKHECYGPSYLEKLDGCLA